MAFEVDISKNTDQKDLKENLKNATKAGMDRIVFLATSAVAMNACQKLLADNKKSDIEVMSWLDVS